MCEIAGGKLRYNRELSLVLCDDLDGKPLQYFCLENPMDGGAW